LRPTFLSFALVLIQLTKVLKVCLILNRVSSRIQIRLQTIGIILFSKWNLLSFQLIKSFILKHKYYKKFVQRIWIILSFKFKDRTKRKNNVKKNSYWLNWKFYSTIKNSVLQSCFRIESQFIYRRFDFFLN
jgi:hypothetical protein